MLQLATLSVVYYLMETDLARSCLMLACYSIYGNDVREQIVTLLKPSSALMIKMLTTSRFTAGDAPVLMKRNISI